MMEPIGGVGGLLEESSRKHPERVFLRNGEHSWTYRKTSALAREVSLLLLRNGVGKGDRVVLFCDNGIQYISAYFGVLDTGAIAVPVNPARMSESIRYIVEKCTPSLILACDATIGRLGAVNDIPPVPVLSLDNSVFREKVGQTSDADSLITPSEQERTDISEEDPALILFTSGTTANPKGVTLTHGNLLSNTEAIQDYLKLGCGDSVLMTLPFTYSYGNSVLLTHAAAGAAIVLDSSSAYPIRVLEGLSKYRVTGFSTVGSYINLMLKCVGNGKGEFPSSLRYITFAGESTNNGDVRYLLEQYPDTRIYVMYGQTEATARLSYLSPEFLPGKIGSVGKGLCNTELKVADPEGNPVKPGETGEILARGPGIMKGYWNDPEETRKVLGDGWLHTGDMATVDPDGFLYIKGRSSDLIKHMGHRISPVEIESILNNCPLVKESAVVEGILDGLPVIRAYIVPVEGAAENGGFSMEEVRRHACPKLPVYMRPQVFEWIERLPRTESGKIKRKALRSMECAE